MELGTYTHTLIDEFGVKPPMVFFKRVTYNNGVATHNLK
jgi:hypothetical protein